MAARLPVVISQSTRRQPAMVAYEEKLVTELLFASGLDATLIGPLESIEADSTDHLCLEGLKGPFALLSWEEASRVGQALDRLKISGKRVDRERMAMEEGGAMASPLDRPIDCFRLNMEHPPKYWVSLLQEILQARNVQAFTILMPGRTGGKPEGPIGRIERAVEPSKPQSSNEARIASRPTADEKVVHQPIHLDADEEEWFHLDTLMDELDRSDV